MRLSAFMPFSSGASSTVKSSGSGLSPLTSSICHSSTPAGMVAASTARCISSEDSAAWAGVPCTKSTAASSRHSFEKHLFNPFISPLRPAKRSSSLLEYSHHSAPFLQKQGQFVNEVKGPRKKDRRKTAVLFNGGNLMKNKQNGQII